MKDKLNEMQSKLLDCLINDLNDPDRRTPGLYTVVRGILSDHKDQVNKIPNESIEAVEAAMKDAAPFKIKKAAY
jgi:formylmethanofuran dehydrogenase subunit B